MDVFAAVPVKDLANAKQRLVPALSAEERGALARAMLDDVLTALETALGDSVFVVTTDACAIQAAERHGARCLIEPGNRGHTEAVAFAQREAVSRRAARFLTIPGDVPCVTAEEIALVCGAGGEGAGVVFVPSDSGLGTNAALLAPPDIMPLKFGEPSFDNHLLAARQRGLPPVVRALPGIGLDIDAPEDLGLLLERGPRTRSAALLASWNFPARLGPRGETARR